MIVVTDQQHRRQRGGFEGHPKQAQIVEQRHSHHGADENRGQDVVTAQQGRVDFAKTPLLAQKADRVDAARQGDKRIKSDDQHTQGVRPQDSAPGFDRAAGEDFHGEPHRQPGVDGEGEQVDPLQQDRFAQPPAEQAGQQGHERQKCQQHSALPSARGLSGGIVAKRIMAFPG